eukprot:gene1675-2209_t
MPANVTARDVGDHGVTLTLADGTMLAAPLLIVAEGRRSPTRDAAGFSIANWSYHHHALIGAVAHERPHGNVAHEIFYPSGPFALLPLVDDAEGRHRSAFVWTVSEKDGPGFAKLGDRGFVAELQKRAGGVLGAMDLVAPRMTYPLGFHHSASIVTQRIALEQVNEALDQMGRGEGARSLDIVGEIARIVLARPERLNAFSDEMKDRLIEITRQLQLDASVRAVLLCAEGRAFCAGGDIDTMGASDVVAARARIQHAHRAILGLANLDKPVVAAVRGPALGVGFSLALSSDLLIASTTARFGVVFKKVGLAPDGGL